MPEVTRWMVTGRGATRTHRRRSLHTRFSLHREDRRILILMSKHRVPRWINALWLILVFSEILLFALVAVRGGCDFVQVVGFVAASFGAIFGIAVIAGLALYGLSILLEGLEFHRSHCGKEDHSGDMANLVP